MQFTLHLQYFTYLRTYHIIWDLSFNNVYTFTCRFYCMTQLTNFRIITKELVLVRSVSFEIRGITCHLHEYQSFRVSGIPVSAPNGRPFNISINP